MPTTAREEGKNLVIDFGEAGTFSIPPMPGKSGKEALSLLLGVTFGTTRQEHGIERENDDTEKLRKMCLSLSGIAGFGRELHFNKLRAEHQLIVSQAAILWNVQGGSIDAVNDLIDEAGGYPKALGRVMQSCGLGQAYEALKTLLDGVGQALSSAAGSMPSTTIPSGTASTSA